MVTAPYCSAPFNGAPCLLTRTEIYCSPLIDLTGFDAECLKRDIPWGRVLKCSSSFCHGASRSGCDLHVAVGFCFSAEGLEVGAVSGRKLHTCLFNCLNKLVAR